MSEIQVVFANYRAKNQKSFLAYLESLSEKRGDGGALHGGHIHFIQGRMEMALKAAIAAVLEKVPDVFPLDLPEQVDKGGLEPTVAQVEAAREINEWLIIPVDGGQIVQIIRLAREYAELEP